MWKTSISFFSQTTHMLIVQSAEQLAVSDHLAASCSLKRLHIILRITVFNGPAPIWSCLSYQDGWNIISCWYVSLWMTDAVKTWCHSSGRRGELSFVGLIRSLLSPWFSDSWIYSISTVYPGRQEPLWASIHPPRRLPFYSTQRRKFRPDVTSNKRKATGIEGGIRPIFCVTPKTYVFLASVYFSPLSDELL